MLQTRCITILPANETKRSKYEIIHTKNISTNHFSLSKTKEKKELYFWGIYISHKSDCNT